MTTNRDDGTLAEKEFSLIQEIAKSPTRTQRDLSQSIGLSLGMTNLLIKRLARKGLIKVKALDWNRAQYLLTLKGALEKARKSYDYSLYTVRIFRQIRENIAIALKREHAAGNRSFAVVAQDELLELVKDTASDLALEGAEFVFVNRYEDLPADAKLVLSAMPEPPKKNGSQRRVLTLVDFENIDFRLNGGGS